MDGRRGAGQEVGAAGSGADGAAVRSDGRFRGAPPGLRLSAGDAVLPHRYAVPAAGRRAEWVLRGAHGALRLPGGARSLLSLGGQPGRLVVLLLPVAGHLVGSDGEGAGRDLSGDDGAV